MKFTWTFVVYRTVDLVTLIIHSPQSWHKKQLLRARRRLCFWQSCSWQVVKQSAVFLLGGAAVRPTADNNAFYLRAKASVEEVEATTQDEAQPDNRDAIVAQTKQFKQDITLHNRRSIHHYCLIGRNLNALKNKKRTFTCRKCTRLQSLAHTISYKFVQIIFILYKNKTNNRSNT